MVGSIRHIGQFFRPCDPGASPSVNIGSFPYIESGLAHDLLLPSGASGTM
jgi:hypothetical protein